MFNFSFIKVVFLGNIPVKRSIPYFHKRVLINHNENYFYRNFFVALIQLIKRFLVELEMNPVCATIKTAQ